VYFILVEQRMSRPKERVEDFYQKTNPKHVEKHTEKKLVEKKKTLTKFKRHACCQVKFS
jgi:hypothetical protein